MIDVKEMKEMTRAQAERLAAKTTDEAVLRQLAGHKNKHVAHKAAFKLARLGAP
jgi:hypothetical protein